MTIICSGILKQRETGEWVIQFRDHSDISLHIRTYLSNYITINTENISLFLVLCYIIEMKKLTVVVHVSRKTDIISLLGYFSFFFFFSKFLNFICKINQLYIRIFFLVFIDAIIDIVFLSRHLVVCEYNFKINFQRVHIRDIIVMTPCVTWLFA